MDRILQRIAEIDKQASMLESKMKEMVSSNETHMKATLEDLEKEEMEKAKKIGKKRYDTLLYEGEQEKEEIIKEANEYCKRLELDFQKVEKELGQELFREVLDIEGHERG